MNSKAKEVFTKLNEHKGCPKCGSRIEDGKCDECGYKWNQREPVKKEMNEMTKSGIKGTLEFSNLEGLMFKSQGLIVRIVVNLADLRKLTPGGEKIDATTDIAV